MGGFYCYSHYTDGETEPGNRVLPGSQSPLVAHGKFPAKPVFPEAVSSPTKRFCPSGSGALKDCTRGNPVRSSPQCGRPKEGTGKPDHWAFAHAQICWLDCLLACLPMDDPPPPTSRHIQPPAPSGAVSSAPFSLLCLLWAPETFYRARLHRPLPRPSAPPASLHCDGVSCACQFLVGTQHRVSTLLTWS